MIKQSTFKPAWWLPGQHLQTLCDSAQVCWRVSIRKVGYLLNFGEALMKDGIPRIINGNLE
jgi:hypothetical protein